MLAKNKNFFTKIMMQPDNNLNIFPYQKPIIKAHGVT
jgi:hypothetical protein